jgi:hypothetical protein
VYSAAPFFSAMHGSLVTSSLIRETTENESANEGYRFGQEEERHRLETPIAHTWRVLCLRSSLEEEPTSLFVFKGLETFRVYLRTERWGRAKRRRWGDHS